MNDISSDVPRPEAVRDLSQTLAAQQAAGAAQTEELARNFLTRVQADIDEQVDQRVQQRLASWTPPKGSVDVKPQVSLALGSIIAAIPLTVIAGNVAALHGWGIPIVLGFLGWLNAAWSWAWSQRS